MTRANTPSMRLKTARPALEVRTKRKLGICLAGIRSRDLGERLSVEDMTVEDGHGRVEPRDLRRRSLPRRRVTSGSSRPGWKRRRKEDVSGATRRFLGGADTTSSCRRGSRSFFSMRFAIRVSSSSRS